MHYSRKSPMRPPQSAAEGTLLNPVRPAPDKPGRNGATSGPGYGIMKSVADASAPYLTRYIRAAGE